MVIYRSCLITINFIMYELKVFFDFTLAGILPISVAAGKFAKCMLTIICSPELNAETYCSESLY